MIEESQLVARGMGLWGVASVPKKDWRCVDTYDLGEPSQTCQMCQTKTIRYVHVMEHDDYSGTLEVGCVCAGHMSDDLEGATQRERVVRNKTAQRKRQEQAAREAAAEMERTPSPPWMTSQNGNPYVRVDKYMTVVFANRRGLFGYGITSKGEKMVFAPQSYGDQQEAKQAAWAALGKLISTTLGETPLEKMRRRLRERNGQR